MSIEAMKQALEALEYADEMIDTACVPKAITNLRIAIEQAEKIEPVMGTKTWYEDGKVITQNLYPSDVYKQEKQDVEQSSTESKETFDQPVAWIVDNERGVIAPQREWVGLTDEEVKALVSWWPSYDQMPALMVLVKDIQNSIKEKNT